MRSDDSARAVDLCVNSRLARSAIHERKAKVSHFAMSVNSTLPSLNRAKDFIKNSDKVIFMGHSGADYDCFGAAMGLQRAVRSLGKIPFIVYDNNSPAIKDLYNELKEQGYNLFDLNDKFYNDICTPYKSPNGTDVLLADRVNYISRNENFIFMIEIHL